MICSFAAAFKQSFGSETRFKPCGNQCLCPRPSIQVHRLLPLCGHNQLSYNRSRKPLCSIHNGFTSGFKSFEGTYPISNEKIDFSFVYYRCGFVVSEGVFLSGTDGSLQPKYLCCRGFLKFEQWNSVAKGSTDGFFSKNIRVGFDAERANQAIFMSAWMQITGWSRNWLSRPTGEFIMQNTSNSPDYNPV